MKLDAPLSFVVFLVCSITDYGECPCVGELSPVTLSTQVYSYDIIFPSSNLPFLKQAIFAQQEYEIVKFGTDTDKFNVEIGSVTIKELINCFHFQVMSLERI